MRIFAMFIAVLFIPTPAIAWHKYGHMAVARIAWQQLDAKERKRVEEILKAHAHDGIDHYKVCLSAGRPMGDAAIPENEWAFANAAFWSDWIRDPKQYTSDVTKAQSSAITKKFHRGPWHYINLPFAHPADAEFFGPDKIAALRKDRLEPYF